MKGRLSWEGRHSGAPEIRSSSILMLDVYGGY